jgi:hypothetical protein
MNFTFLNQSNLIYQKSEDWFQNSLDLNDIESALTKLLNDIQHDIP